MGDVLLVHNGIIENYRELRATLQAEGIECVSDTDTEVVAQMIAHLYSRNNDAELAFSQVIAQLKGAFSLVAMFSGLENFALAARNGSSLTVGKKGDFQQSGEDNSAVYIASDPMAYSDNCEQWAQLPDESWLVLRDLQIECYSMSDGQSINLTWQPCEVSLANFGKGNFRHFMEKEIFEQPDVLTHTLGYYLDTTKGMPRDFTQMAMRGETDNSPADTVYSHKGLEELDFTKYNRILMVACGTAWHSACIARYNFESFAGIPASVELASELRYRNPVIEPKTLAIFVSQSGETADTLAALSYCYDRTTTLAVVNAEMSALAHEAHMVAPLKVGQEIGVASTKAFTAMLCTLGCLILIAAQQRKTCSEKQISDLTKSAISLPRIVSETIKSLQKSVADVTTKIVGKTLRNLSRARSVVSASFRRSTKTEGNFIYSRPRIRRR